VKASGGSKFALSKQSSAKRNREGLADTDSSEEVELKTIASASIQGDSRVSIPSERQHLAWLSATAQYFFYDRKSWNKTELATKHRYFDALQLLEWKSGGYDFLALFAVRVDEGKNTHLAVAFSSSFLPRPVFTADVAHEKSEFRNVVDPILIAASAHFPIDGVYSMLTENKVRLLSSTIVDLFRNN